MKLIEKIKDIIFRIKDYNSNRSADYYNEKFARKLLHNKPIYRVDILRAVKYDYRRLRMGGICTSISRICRLCIKENSSLRYMDCMDAKKLFSKLSRSNANGFQLDGYGEYGYWWKFGDWNGGRM